MCMTMVLASRLSACRSKGPQTSGEGQGWHCYGRDPTGEPMNPEQLQSLAVLALAIVPVAVLWWVWIRMLR